MTHRDIKPENIYITDDLVVILIDFGLAREMRTSYIGETDAGTEEYKAPEFQISKFKITFKIDCWALGLILYFLCTLDHAFKGDQDSVKAKVLSG